MECKFSGQRQSSNELVTIISEEATQTDQFRYLGLIIHSNGEMEEDVTKRIKACLLKWRNASEILSDR